MVRPLTIALTADPELPVPPRFYGGIERVVDLLARGLVARGHDVTLFAHPESNTAGSLVSWPGRNSSSVADTIRNATTLTRHIASGDFDVLHSFSRLAYLLPVLPSKLPKIMSYQRAISRRTTTLAHQLSHGTLEFTAISNWMINSVKDIGHWHMIPNGVPIDTFVFRSSVADDGPLLFLGRLEEIKGPHLAIEIAKRTGHKLIIAGNIPADKKPWVDSHVMPHVDGDQIRYVGPVNDQQKNALLGHARAFLMPILWEEPFGIVMAEALACGTPVLGLRRGAVPEVVVDGLTGFVRDTVDELVEMVPRIGSLSRAQCRMRAEQTYSATAVVEAYIKLYHSITSSPRRGRP